jgi:hypothetical protein
MLLVLGLSVVLLLLLTLGGLLAWSGALSWFGRLPGDIRYGRGKSRVHVPLASALLVSVLLSALSWVVRRLL